MIDFIIYEKNVKAREKYELIILNVIGIREEKFKIYNYNNYMTDHNFRSIYIISTDKIRKALDIAKEIRNSNNWESQIIIISNLSNINSNELINNLLILDYINKQDNVLDRLKKDLYIAYKILTSHKVLSVSVNREIYKIPYEDILYIEKCNNQNYCNIYTKDIIYTVKDTINKLERKLDQAYFMKTHRSCIVNLYNIEYYNCPKNTIYFTNGKEIDLVSRERRQILKSKLIEEKITK